MGRDSVAGMKFLLQKSGADILFYFVVSRA